MGCDPDPCCRNYNGGYHDCRAGFPDRWQGTRPATAPNPGGPMKKYSDLPPGAAVIVIDGEVLAPGRTKVAIDGPPYSPTVVISITTDPENQTYNDMDWLAGVIERCKREMSELDPKTRAAVHRSAQAITDSVNPRYVHTDECNCPGCS